MRNIKYIVWHTAAFAKNESRDVDAATIRQWHIERGWSDIGYHAVIRFDGKIEWGRPAEKVGAHVAGLNAESLGICFAGHGDLAPLTEEQMGSGLALTREWMQRFDVPVDNVIGHREVDDLEIPGVSAHGKTCPGKLVDMVLVRGQLQGAIPIGPRITYDIERKNVLAMQFQEFLRDAGEDIVVDGFAGDQTSDVTQRVFGFRLHGDPREQETT